MWEYDILLVLCKLRLVGSESGTGRGLVLT